MKYAFENLSPDQFESLIIALCQYLLGMATQGFATGPDGGRDAKFVGTAELFPSKSSPWIGTIIVQAKHTNGFNKTFSDTDFFSEERANSVIVKEIPRIKNLRNAKELDHYILFSNRRLTGGSESRIKAYLAKECKIPKESIFLCDIKQMEFWLKQFPRAAEMAKLDPVDSPLIVCPDDLAEIVEALAANIPTISAKLQDIPEVRVSYKQKNIINNMSEEYAKESQKRYLKETRQIQEFFSDPQNEKILTHYNSVVEEFQMKIIAKRKDYQTFDEVLEYLFDLLFERDPILQKNKKLTRTIVFYMYWNCDLGEKVNDQTEQTFTS